MPSFLVFGCANFYGRAVIEQLCAERDKAIEANVEAKDSWVIRGVDKILPQLAYFPTATLKLYESFDYRIGNLRSYDFIKRAFEKPTDNISWDYVINLAAEHKFGQTIGVYEEDVHQVSVNIAKLAVENKAGSLVQLSTAHLYGVSGDGNSTDNKRHNEEAPVEALNELAGSHLRAEKDIENIFDEGLAILRPALCYGPGDRQNVVPLLIAAQLSRESGEPMPVLWDKDLRVNTVHVSDVARAIILVARHCKKYKKKLILNLSDPGDTTNAKLAKTVAKLFAVKPSFHNFAFNYIAKRLKTEELTEEVNESLLGPWMELLANNNVANSPLSPYLDQEHPYCRLEYNPLGVDGSKIEKVLGFKYEYSEISQDALRQMIEEFQQLGLWPKINI
ncbi:NAD(P)-binding protein [Coemansia reversa NRRL 1564]|uniref:NAD(P)-binding protein n=1 Tax=Coemansia reversa (strain ATCC 12441 / NRRL 1564) TaxID=763665 RepID=A0A2G5B7C3_COERN|nr:NAD(P)-binding protein [Coemansia reversa NRRL 1564]|eukprot:PIA14627.1 NAD(P)-binding protein [Coemansia reversa NRRL 1564]